MDQYTIEDLTRIIKVSKQSIYNLLSKDKAFLKDHSIRKQRKLYYDQEVLKMLMEYYNIDPAENKQEEAVEQPQEAVEPQEEPAIAIDSQKEIEALKGEIEALKAKLSEREERIKSLEEKEQELIKQNGLTLLLLQEEKREKMILLPDPTQKKKSFWQRLTGK